MFPPEKLSGVGLFGKVSGGWCGCSQGIELNTLSDADARLLEREKALGWILMNGFDLNDAPVNAEAFIAPWRSKFCVRSILIFTSFLLFTFEQMNIFQSLLDTRICFEQEFQCPVCLYSQQYSLVWKLAVFDEDASAIRPRNCRNFAC